MFIFFLFVVFSFCLFDWNMFEALNCKAFSLEVTLYREVAGSLISWYIQIGVWLLLVHSRRPALIAAKVSYCVDVGNAIRYFRSCWCGRLEWVKVIFLSVLNRHYAQFACTYSMCACGLLCNVIFAYSERSNLSQRTKTCCIKHFCNIATHCCKNVPYQTFLALFNSRTAKPSTQSAFRNRPRFFLCSLWALSFANCENKQED